MATKLGGLLVVSKTKNSKTKTEVRSTQISKTKHPNLENGAPKTRKRSTQNSKAKHPKLETFLSFKKTRQSLVKLPAVGIKHDNEKNAVQNCHHIKGLVEIGCLTKFGALRLNRDQVVTLKTWLKIHTNVCNFVTGSPK